MSLFYNPSDDQLTSKLNITTGITNVSVLMIPSGVSCRDALSTSYILVCMYVNCVARYAK